MKFSRAIRHLNMKDVNRKQLQKEKALKEGTLSEQPTMTTSNIYPEVSEEPNQDLSDFEAIMTGGERLGFSGADGNTAGNANIGDAQGLTGVALSPPHPVTGVRIHAIHRTTGLGDSTPLRPGVTISRGFSDNPPQYTMGSVLWFYDSDFNNGAGQPAGKWCNLEFSNFEGDTNGKWFFWDTIKTGQFAGIYIANTDLSQHPCGDIGSLIDGLNFPGIGGSLGAAKIPVLTVKGLETEPIYPGPIANLFGLGGRAFEWMKEKAEEWGANWDSNMDGMMEKMKEHWQTVMQQGADFGEDVQEFINDKKEDLAELGKAAEVYLDYLAGNLNNGDIDNDYLGQDYVDMAFEEAEVNDKGTVSVGENIIGSGGKPQYNPDTGVVTIPFEYDFDTNEEQIMKDPNKYDPRNSIVTAAGMVSAWILGGKYGLDSTPVPFAGYATWLSKTMGGGKPTTGHGITMPIEQVKEKNPNFYNYIIQNKIGVSESYISESAKLGHFEPDILDVDINDIRKGIMPEYPKQPPAEMIDGYHEKSALRPKPLDNKPYVKISKADLIRNHRIKPSEVDEMINTINRLNDYIKKHPEDLIYVQQRYPKDDPRLAELNWKMDQMLKAGEEYLDSNFKENQTLYKRAIDRTKNNIKLTDPKYAQQRYDELRGTVKPKKTNLVGRLGKHLNKYESKGVLRHVDSDDFKKINELKIERKEQVKQIQNEIEIEFQEKKNDWRLEFYNPKDIKPEFPKNPPPKLDSKTGMHPQYGKRADRFTKLDPISADSMPLTGDPETDAIVKKQKNKKNFKEWSQQLDSMWKSDWRNELKEGMTTTDTFITVTPGKGDVDLSTTGTGYQDGIHQLQNIPSMITVDDPTNAGKGLGGGPIGAGYQNVYGAINQYDSANKEALGQEASGYNQAVDGTTLDDNNNPRYSDYIYPFDRAATGAEIQTAKDASQVRGADDVFRATYPTNVFSDRHKATPVTTNPTVGTDDAYDTVGLGVRWGGAYDTRTPRFFVPSGVNTSEIDTVKILASVPSNNQGVTLMNQAGSQLQLYYWAGDKPGFQSLQNVNAHNASSYPSTKRQHDGWRPIAQKPNGEIDSSVNSNIIDIIKPDGFQADKVSEFNLKIPEWCRTTNTRFMFLQMSSSNGGPTLYSIRYQRRNALTINTTLEDEISSAYVRAGMDSNLTAAERKKKLEERLRASREYMIKSLGFADLFKDEVKISDVVSNNFDFQSVMQGSGAYGNARFNDLVSLEKRQKAAGIRKPQKTKSRGRFRGYKRTGRDSKGMTTSARVNPKDIIGSI